MTGEDDLPLPSGKPSGNLPLPGEEEDSLTPRQLEVYKLLSRGCCKIDDLAQRLGISKRAVRNHTKVLRDKGLVKMPSPGFYTLPDYLPEPRDTPPSGGSGDAAVTKSGDKVCNLHGEQFSIKPAWKSEKYEDFVNARFSLDGNTVHVFRDSVQVYSNKRFWSDSARKCTVKSVGYWNRFFNRLEDRLGGSVLVKPGSNNVKRVQAHYEEVRNGVSRQASGEGERIRLYADEDGKLWFETDSSLGEDAVDTTHPETSERDMAEVVRPLLNDLRREVEREGRVTTMSDLKELLGALIRVTRENAAGLNSILQLKKDELRGLRDLKRDGEGDGVGRPGYVG